MSYTSVISHPPKIPYRKISADYVAICRDAPDSACAATILDLCEFWTSYKNQIAEDEQNESEVDAWFMRSESKMKDDLFNVWGINKLRDNRKWLISVDYLEMKQIERALGGKQNLYRLNIDLVQSKLDSLPPVNNNAWHTLKITSAYFKNNDKRKRGKEQVKIGASAKSNPIHDDTLNPDEIKNVFDYEHEILSSLSDEWLPLSALAISLELSPDGLTEIIASHSAQIALDGLIRSQQIDYTLMVGDERHYRLAQTKDDMKVTPRKKMNHRETYIHAIEQVTGTKAAKTDEALYYKVANALVESKIPLDDFERHYKFVVSEAKDTGEWKVTVPSLISNGRLSRSIAKRDKQSGNDENTVWEW